ncbi:hypothetical protein ACJMK2_007236 [Sinanodonta woodiana]|uniref:Uncharacterized protein n=1 Tax=Sinanodonta woodiana TaxID=1069815 RepID=A0ABD3VHV8_SINWO
MDGTFKYAIIALFKTFHYNLRVLGEPFRQQGQLISIHAFIERNDAQNQFPLVFYLMSRNTKSHYLVVFRSLQSRLEHVSIEGFVLRKKAFPGVELKGRAFHWSQAVWRHVQSVELAETYMRREGLHSFVRQVLALQFLQSAHMRQTVQMLQMKATTQWMDNSVFPAETWSVYRQKVRTNNDVEGKHRNNKTYEWHHRLSSRAVHMGLVFYQLVPLLRREADLLRFAVQCNDLGRERRCFRFEKSLNTLLDQYM